MTKLSYLSLSICLFWAPISNAAKVPFRIKPLDRLYLDCNTAYQQKAYTQAIPLCQKEAEEGDLNAHTMLGLMYYRGLGFLQDAYKAREHFQFAAQRGNEVAQFHLAKLMLMGALPSTDEKIAFSWLEKAAYQHYAPAEFLVAICYRNGIGTPINLNQSIYWYKQAKVHGIGSIVGTKPDPIAFKMNLDIANDVDPHIIYLRGKEYLNGYNGVPQNDAMAFHHFEYAAQKNHPEAQGYLAWMLALGLGGEVNLPQAVYWFNAGQPLKHMADLPVNTNDRIAKNNHLLRYSADTPEKQLAMGRELIETAVNEKDRQAGVNLIELAAYHHNADAQLYLSTLYHEGRHLKQDLSLAFQYAEKAATAGHPDAQYAVGWHYANGIGTQKNLTKAYSWFDKSGRKGNPRAQMAQDFIAKQLNNKNATAST